MKIHDLVQGSPEWHAYRADHWNASDAPAMMGVSPYKTRSQLLHERFTGIGEEITPEKQRIFNAGHEFEAMARPLAELIIGESLYPVVASEGAYSASFDGITMAANIVFEHKSLNDELRACMLPNGIGGEVELPAVYRVQCEQQLMISGAERVLFMASKWAPDGTLIEERHCWYLPDSALRAQIVAGWTQFEADLQAYVPPTAAAAAPAGKAPDSLPALRIEVSGMVKASNLAQFKTSALAVIRSVNRELKTDEDFASAEKAVKWCEDVEESLAAGKRHALSQTETIDALFRTIDEISAEARDVRLELQKLVKARKEAIKGEIVAAAVQLWVKHLDTLDPALPRIQPDWTGVIKSKRTVASLRDAVDTELARCKIEANQWFTLITKNRATLAQHADHAFLFSDTGALVLKQPDDLSLVIRTRIADHEAMKVKRLEVERERMRLEEQANARREIEVADAVRRQAEADAELREEARGGRAVAAASAPASAGIIDRGESAAGKALVAAMAPPPAPRADEPATLNLGAISERLGFTVPGNFMSLVGIEGVPGPRGSRMFTESQFDLLCFRLQAHIEKVQNAARAALFEAA